VFLQEYYTEGEGDFLLFASTIHWNFRCFAQFALSGRKFADICFLTPQTAVFRCNPGEKSFLSVQNPLPLALCRTAQLAPD
jgi:hypothetical protein